MLSPNDFFVFLILDMKEEALRLIEEYSSKQPTPYVGIFGYLTLKGHPIYTNVREEPRFQKMLKEAKVYHDERVSKYYHLFDD